MNIVIGSSYLWADRAKVGIHAFAEHFLAKGGKVDWFTIPFSLLHFVKPTNLRVKWQRLRLALRPAKEVASNGFLVNRVPLSLFHPVNLPLLDTSIVVRSYLRFSLYPLKKACHWDGISPVDVLLFDSGGLSLYYPLEALSNITIYRLSDLVAEFPGQVNGKIECEREILKKVDLVLPVSESLYEAAVKIRRTDVGVHLLPNGVDVEFFTAPRTEPTEYKNIPPPRALFAGTLSNWIDWELLIRVANLRPSVSFVVIGRGAIPKVLPKNVYQLGSRPHSEIPAYMQYADVGLIPFKNLPRIHRVEKPLKFYEYLAAGLPVVSVPYGNLKKMAPYALFGTSPAEFAEAIDEALTISSHPDERKRRQEEARRYSWSNVFAKFDEILRSVGVRI